MSDHTFTNQLYKVMKDTKLYYRHVGIEKVGSKFKLWEQEFDTWEQVREQVDASYNAFSKSIVNPNGR